ncbi:MAG TPA: ABC transporter permease [Bellilinea sp.]|nr:ABC transporter permease [Bellilinea sp.]
MIKTSASWLSKIKPWLPGSTIAAPVAVLLVVLVLFSVFVPKFFSFRSISGIINAATLTGALAIGIGFLMVAGEFDLSVGSNLAISGYIYGTLTAAGQPFLGLLLALVVPSILGAVNGIILVWTGIPSFIVTLGTKYFYRGMLWVITTGSMLQTVDTLPIDKIFTGRLDVFNNLVSDANFRNSALWLILLAFLFQIILSKTKFGNHVFAVGSNPGAALGQGVRVARVKIISFAISGFMAGVAGILLFSQFHTVRVSSGDGMDLYAIAAAVVGGVLITGGAGNIWGALVGALIISTLRTGVVLLDIPFIPADNFEAIVGVTIVGAAILNMYISKRK